MARRHLVDAAQASTVLGHVLQSEIRVDLFEIDLAL
jgi:hypothetical protein